MDPFSGNQSPVKSTDPRLSLDGSPRPILLRNVNGYVRGNIGVVPVLAGIRKSRKSCKEGGSR